MSVRPLRARRPVLLALSLLLALAAAPGCDEESGEVLALPGLSAEVRVVTDAFDVPHLFAENDTDLAIALGFVHARDRFWQMDVTRRTASGDLAELVGPRAIGDDILLRTLGLRRAAERSATLLTDRERELLEAYATGVNYFLATHPLPPEYAELELSSARPWDPIDSLVIGKAIATNLSLDIDTGLTDALDRYVDVLGEDLGMQFFADVHRSAPMDPASTVPDATGATPFLVASARHIDRDHLRVAARLARAYEAKAKRVPMLARAIERRHSLQGSNEWGVSARYSKSRRPMIANDPHLGLEVPNIFYENHMIVANDPVDGPMNVSGVTFPGFPVVILGQNERITWGATTNPMDVSDVFADKLVRSPDPRCAAGGGVCIESAGELHPIETIFAKYGLNDPGDGVVIGWDEVPDAGAVVPFSQRFIFTVPFRGNGPVIDVDDASIFFGGASETTALVLQFTGLHATQEARTFRVWNRARDLDDFLEGLAFFDFGSQNWAYADMDGNLGYFASAEMPLRRDLEEGHVVGLPPFFVRDGRTGENDWVADPALSQGQSTPYAILPFEEMPHTLNPENGFFVNANNDPAGTTLDGDPLNQRRPSHPTAIYYLNPGYDEGLRAGRITRLVASRVRAGKRLSLEDLQRFQLNNQQLDAELVVPHLLAAWENAEDSDAPAELAALASDPELEEAIERLADWDFSTPTGIPEGFDAGDKLPKADRGDSDSRADSHADSRRKPRKEPRPKKVKKKEARASVAATIYNVWRAKAIKSVVDPRIASLGVPGVGSTDALKVLHALLSEAPFTGMVASGVQFFPEPAALPVDARRDLALLEALRAALDALASDLYAPAFARSRDQDDYRWGRLHRITFRHELGGMFSIPPAAGFEDLADNLPGVPRDGGFEVVNASGFSARADGPNSFRFGGGPVRRYVGAPGAGKRGGSPMLGFNVIPGGRSGVLGDPSYATQLPLWLVGAYHDVPMTPREVDRAGESVEVFGPAGP